jgi:retron-type reverse transcriptase
MSMGRREERHAPMWVSGADLARSPGHRFYEKLNELLSEAKFDRRGEAHRRVRKDGAPGVDGTSAEQSPSAKSGTYRALPVRRVHIPKGDGSQTRPIGIPTFEDKVLCP